MRRDLQSSETIETSDKLAPERSFDLDGPSLEDSSAFTVSCYKRRKQILAGTNRTEWWMAGAVMALLAGVAFVVL